VPADHDHGKQAVVTTDLLWALVIIAGALVIFLVVSRVLELVGAS
jgi:hypothetical protein